MQNLLLHPPDAFIPHSAKRQSGVREYPWISVERTQTTPDSHSVHGGTARPRSQTHGRGLTARCFLSARRVSGSG